MKDIILASQSPRRRELLTQIGLEFEVLPSTVEEVITSTDPVEAVKELAQQKARDVEREVRVKRNVQPGLVIGADTIVVYGGKMS